MFRWGKRKKETHEKKTSDCHVAENLPLSSDRSNRYVLAAAIDFGTTYSGYAYSYQDKEKIYLNAQWQSGSQSYKVPTAVLFDNENNFIAFGVQAENEYHICAGDRKESEYMFFNKFKMVLYHEENIVEDFQLTAANGKSMPALEVFSSAISFLKQHLLNAINITRLGNNRLEANNVLWVLTVPAIWSEKSKHFMIEAAKKAGIDKGDLCIALEPECAAIFCNKLYSNKTNSKVGRFGAKYMVIDLGGGTCDIVIHELLENGDAKEIERASGTDAGGTTVDNKFQEYLGKILTMTVIEEMKAKNPADWKNIERDLELIKKSLNDRRGSAIVTLTSCLNDAYIAFNSICISEAFESNDIEQTVREHVDMQGKHRLKVDKLIFENMIKEVSRQVKDEIQALLYKSKINLDYVVLAGGFSNSSIVLEEMEDYFNPIPVVRPREAELAVLRGAVLYGLRENQITSRISRQTYGVCNSRKFQDGDPECLSYYDAKNKWCNLFDTIVTIGESFKTSDKVTKIYHPVVANLKKVLFHVYSSKKKNVKYCNEEGVYKLGTIEVEMPDTTGGTERILKVEISFGKTYMQVDVTDQNSNKVFNATFDFLCK